MLFRSLVESGKQDLDDQWTIKQQTKPSGFRYRPPHSSMISAMVLASSPVMMRMFFRPSRTTWTTWESFTDSRSQKGGMTFSWTRNSTYTNPHIHTTSILNCNRGTSGLQVW